MKSETSNYNLKPQARIAVIGGGVAGIVSSYLLQKKYSVSLFEAESRLGGHTNTVEISSGPDAGVAVDTGFIVLNNRNYPLFSKFLAELGVPVRWSDMSFSYECRNTGFAYAGTDLNGLFAERKNILSPRFYRFLSEILRFCREGQRELASKKQDESLTLGEFLQRGAYSTFMRESYLLPMGAAIWSTPLEEILDFPARSFLSFFANHGLLSFKDRPRWQTVEGGSREYVKAFEKAFRGEIRLASAVKNVRSLAEAEGQGVLLELAGGGEERFDACVLATHANQTLNILADADSLEKELLSPWRYEKNHTFLHTDRSFLPLNRRAWASWNYCREAESSRVTVSYHMNRLQGLKTVEDYCVTLNPEREVPQEKVIASFLYEHPVYDTRSVATQSRLAQLQGRRGRYFCGSYFGYGFHEDAVRSAVLLGEHLGVS